MDKERLIAEVEKHQELYDPQDQLYFSETGGHTNEVVFLGLSQPKMPDFMVAFLKSCDAF